MRPPSVEIVLEPLVGHTGYAPLAVLGYWLRRTKFLAPLWTPLDWPIKTYMHTPVDKLETLLVSLLAGNRAVSQINTPIRPDSALTQAWGQTQFAEQSTVAEMLNHVCEADLTQLQQGSASLFRRYSQALQHPFAHQWLLVDYDSTGLLISKSAEGSEKGYFSGHRNRYGRQLVRLSAPSYHETLCSALYAGNTHAFATLKETVAAFEQLLPQAQQHRSHIIFRSDAGIGTDANINWLLWRGYHVLTKGFSQTRAAAQARQVAPAAWCQDGDADRWVAPAPRPPRFGRRTEMYVVRWPTPQGFRYSTLISSVPGLSPLSTLHLYDGRGAMEIEIRADKQGLRLPKHHKRSLAAQMVLILLTDIAHNLLSWLHTATLADSPCREFGTLRVVEDLLTIPGYLEFKGAYLRKVALLETHPFAAPMRQTLEKLLKLSSIP